MTESPPVHLTPPSRPAPDAVVTCPLTGRVHRMWRRLDEPASQFDWRVEMAEVCLKLALDRSGPERSEWCQAIALNALARAARHARGDSPLW